jgi:hypothetical protein
LLRRSKTKVSSAFSAFPAKEIWIVESLRNSSIKLVLTRHDVWNWAPHELMSSGAILKALFVAAHESESGPSRHIAEAQRLRRFRGEADIRAS